MKTLLAMGVAFSVLAGIAGIGLLLFGGLMAFLGVGPEGPLPSPWLRVMGYGYFLLGALYLTPVLKFSKPADVARYFVASFGASALCMLGYWFGLGSRARPSDFSLVQDLAGLAPAMVLYVALPTALAAIALARIRNNAGADKQSVASNSQGNHAGRATQVPALWDPHIAAALSLLLSPAFGALLTMLNWQALREFKEAAMARKWFIASLIILAVEMTVALAQLHDGETNPRFGVITFAFFAVWLFLAARRQTSYVKQRLGAGFVRRNWGKPILMAMLAMLTYIALGMGMGIAFLLPG